MDQERRQVSNADAVRPAEVPDRATTGPAVADAPQARVMLFPGEQADRLRAEWTEIQTTFVDAPRSAVERADALVADTTKRIADMFGSERTRLEQQWDRGDDVTTEDLRIALQRYRSFFDRLLSL